MTDDDMRRLFKARCETLGGQAAMAASLRVSVKFVSAMATARKPLTDDALAAIGYERVQITRYRKIRV